MKSDLHLELLFGSRRLLRDNGLCDRIIRQLRRHEAVPDEEIESWRLVRLHRTLLAAISKLPYYRHVPACFPVERTAEVLQEHFPIITKETLLENRRTIYPNSGVPRPWQSVGKTSGTTGTPLCVFRSPTSVLMEQAFQRRHWQWAGFKNGMSSAIMRGQMVVPLERDKPPFWFWNRYSKQLVISSRHLREEYADAIIDELERISPQMLQAYPSTAFTLAQFIKQRNRRLVIPVVFTASEPLYSHQRELIEEVLGEKVMDMYGMAERVAFATECEHGSMHLNPDYSYVELVGDDGLPTSDVGYVVGTTFHNLAMPLIRYKLSDKTRWMTGSCRCNRPFPMIEPVVGKWEDRLSGGNGAFVSPSVLTFAFKGVQNIKKSQVAQVGAEHWEIRLVPAPEFGVDDRQKLIDNIHKLVDPSVEVDVVLNDNIPCTASAKFRWVVNERSRAGERPHF